MTFDMNKVQFEYLDGKCEPVLTVVPEFKNSFRDFLYYSTSNLGLRVFTMDLYKSDTVSVDRAQLESIKEQLPEMKILNPILQSITSYVDSLLAELDGKMADGSSKSSHKKPVKVEK